MKLDAKTITAIGAILTGSGGFVEMRVAVARLETSTAAIEKRVERIEREIDVQRIARLGDLE